MKLIEIIKDFRKYRRKSKTQTKCRICAYEGDCGLVGHCHDCLTNHPKWYIPKLKPITNEEFVDIIINHFLGSHWYVTDPLHSTQINAIAIEEILKRTKSPKINC